MRNIWQIYTQVYKETSGNMRFPCYSLDLYSSNSTGKLWMKIADTENWTTIHHCLENLTDSSSIFHSIFYAHNIMWAFSSYIFCQACEFLCILVTGYYVKGETSERLLCNELPFSSIRNSRGTFTYQYRCVDVSTLAQEWLTFYHPMAAYFIHTQSHRCM